MPANALLAVVLLAYASAATAQPVRPTLARLRTGDRVVERTVGYSGYSPDSSWGDVSHRRVYMIGIRSSWILSSHANHAIAYSMELVPLAVVARTGPNSEICWDESPQVEVCRRDRSTAVAAGLGGSPFGTRFYLRQSDRLRLHGGINAGALIFSSDVPIYDSRRFNFTLALDGAVDVLAWGREITLGYKFHHLSNAATGTYNPGLDANVIYVGLVKRRPR